MEHGFFSMFLHGYREVSAPGLWVNPNCTILTVQKKTWLQRSMVVQLPFLVAHDGWTTLSGFFHTLGMFLQSCCPNTFI